LKFKKDGNLDEVIGRKRAINEKFSKDEIRNWAIQLLEGLKYLHSDRKIIHRDIKPQ
jgi:serine/threonine protein kinase